MQVEHSEKNKQNLLQILMFRFFPYWPLFVVLSVVMLSVALLYLKITPSVYQSNATILINDEKKGVENSTAIGALDIYTSKKIVENEIEVIKSKALMREAVTKLHLYSPVYKKHFLYHSDAYLNSPLIVEVKDLDDLQEAKSEKFVYDSGGSRVLFLGNYYPVGKWIASSVGEIRFVKNPNLKQEQAGEFYFDLVDPREVTDDLLKRLDVVSTSKLSTVVNLSIKDNVPLRGNLILNTLLESYEQAGLNDKDRLASNTLRFVEDRVKLVEHDLDSIEHDIQLYKSSKGVVDLSAQGKLFLQNVGENDQKLAEINMQIATIEQVKDYVSSNSGKSGVIPSSVGILDATLSGMVNKLYDSESQLEQLRNTTAENSPILIGLRNQVQKMRESLLDYISNQRTSLLASRDNLSLTNGQYASVLQNIPLKERQLLELSRQQVIKNNVYTFLLQKKEETALSFSSKVSDSRLVDKAEALIKPVSPKRPVVFAAALAIAFLFSVIYVVAKELFGRKLLFRSEIEDATKIPIVAEVSYTGLKDYVVIDNPKKPFLTEQFRQLRAAVGLYGRTTRKTVMVTSSVSGEGKSFICTNFAVSLARSRKKVLLVDFDLRNPRITRLFKAEKADGVAEYLSDDQGVGKLIIETGYDGLFLLPAGRGISNPIEVLLNGDLDQLFESLKERFDYIIVDTPPVDPVTDAFLLSPYSDTTLFVLRHNKTPKAMVQLLDDNDKIKALKNVSLVFNGVRSRGLIKNTFGYGYGYGYQYVYPDRRLSE